MNQGQTEATMGIYAGITSYLERYAPRAGLAAVLDMNVKTTQTVIRIVLTPDDAAIFDTPEAHEFKQLCILYDLTPEHLGRTYKTTTGRDAYILIGMNRKARLFPALGRRVKDGKIFKTTMPKADQFQKEK